MSYFESCLEKFREDVLSELDDGQNFAKVTSGDIACSNLEQLCQEFIGEQARWAMERVQESPEWEEAKASLETVSLHGAFSRWLKAKRPVFFLPDPLRECFADTSRATKASRFFRLPYSSFSIVFETPFQEGEGFISEVLVHAGWTEHENGGLSVPFEEQKVEDSYVLRFVGVEKGQAPYWEFYQNKQWFQCCSIQASVGMFHSGAIVQDPTFCECSLSKVIYNTITYINQPNAELADNVQVYGKAKREFEADRARLSRKEFDRRFNSVRNMYSKSCIVIAPNEAKKIKDERKKALASPKKYHYCRGHWRNQPVGKRGEGKTELVWVRPHFRGNKELGAVIGKEYQIKDAA